MFSVFGQRVFTKPYARASIVRAEILENCHALRLPQHHINRIGATAALRLESML